MVSCSQFNLSSLPNLLEDAAAERPDAVFLDDRRRTLTYAQTQAEVRSLASFLRRNGLNPGDRVAIQMRNRVEVAIAVFATAAVGGVFVVLNDKLRPKGVEKIFRQAEPRVLIGDAEVTEPASGNGIDIRVQTGADAATAREGWIGWEQAVADPDTLPERPPASGNATVCLVFTSGSTADPRGVELSHANIRFVVAAIQARLNYRPEDVVGCFLPLAFDYGLYQIFLAAQAGARLFIGDPDQVGPRLPRILAEAGVSVLPGVPAVYAALLMLGKRRPIALPALRAVTNTGERLPRAYIDGLKAMFSGLEVYVMYGLTECKRVSILLPEECECRPDSVGRPLDGTEVYAADELGRRLPPGIAGELVVRGPHVAKGYWRAPEETARRYRVTGVNGGRQVDLFTGDRGRVDDEGFLYFAARADDLLKHRGNRISPVEIENEACGIGGVSEAAALKRVADDTLHLFISTDDADLSQNAILSALSKVLEPAKIPDFVHPRPSLPKSINGKTDRKSLQRQLESETTAS